MESMAWSHDCHEGWNVHFGFEEGFLFKLFNRMTIKKMLYKPKHCKQNTTNSHNKENLRFTSSTPVFSKRNVLNQSRTAKIHKDPSNPQLDQSPCGQHCAASCSFWTAHRHPAGLFCTSFAFSALQCFSTQKWEQVGSKKDESLLP